MCVPLRRAPAALCQSDAKYGGGGLVEQTQGILPETCLPISVLSPKENRQGRFKGKEKGQYRIPIPLRKSGRGEGGGWTEKEREPLSNLSDYVFATRQFP